MKEVLEMDPYEFTPSAVPETPFPGALILTDSHSVFINALGVFSWVATNN